MSKLKTAADVHKMPLDRFVANVINMRRANVPLPQKTANITVEAEINYGRLIVRCPYCQGAEMADPEDKRFFCLSCYNEKAGGKWLKVTFSEGVEG